MLGGLALGFAMAYTMTPLLSSLLMGLRPHDSLTFGGISANLIAAVLLACRLPPAARCKSIPPRP